MTQIIKHQGGLTIAENELISAMKETRFVDMSPEKIKAEAFRLVQDAANRIGQKEISEGIFKVAVEDLVYSFQNELKQMTTGEVRIAIIHQSRIDKSFSISSRVIFDWISTWKTTKKLELQKAIKIKNSKEIKEEPKTYTKEEKIEAIEKQFNRYLSGKNISPYIWQYMKDFNLLNDVKMIWRKIDLVCRLYENETKANVNHLLLSVRKKRLEEIQNVKDRKGVIPDYIQNRSQKLIIEQVFEDLKEFNQTPKDVIEP